MIINYLTGSLVFREHKTGVHIFHENLISQSLLNNKDNTEYKVSCYNTKSEVECIGKHEAFSKKARICYSHKLARILTYFLPIEFFFGKSDCYICDGLIPHTIRKSKVVAIIFDLMVKKYPNNYSLIKRVYLDYYFAKCKKADMIITISETTKQDIVKYLNIEPQKIVVVPCGFEIFENTLSEEGYKYSMEEYFLYIGDMRKNKNLLSAIKGFELACKKNQKLKFYIAGKKDFEYENLKKYVMKNNLENNVIFLGYISESEKSILYTNSLGLLFVSEYEGFGIPILEAAAYNTAVITSNCSSMREIAGNYSILVNPHSEQEICDALLSLQNKKNRMQIINNQKELLKKYNWENMYKKFHDSISRIL